MRWWRARGTTRYDPKKLALAQQLATDPQRSITEICQTLEIARTTFYRYARSVGALDAGDFGDGRRA